MSAFQSLISTYKEKPYSLGSTHIWSRSFLTVFCAILVADGHLRATCTDEDVETYCYNVERIVGFVCTYVVAVVSCEETNKGQIEDKTKVSTYRRGVADLWWTVSWKLGA